MRRVLASYPAQTKMGKESSFMKERNRHREENTTQDTETQRSRVATEAEIRVMTLYAEDAKWHQHLEKSSRRMLP